MDVPLAAPDYTCISKREKTVEVKYRKPCRGPVTHLVVDSTGLKVYGEGEWKTRKHVRSGDAHGVSCTLRLTLIHTMLYQPR